MLVAGCRGGKQSSDAAVGPINDAGPSPPSDGPPSEPDAAAATDAATDAAAGGPDGAQDGPAGLTLKGRWVALGAPLGAQIGTLGWGDDGTLFAGSSDAQIVVGGVFASSDRGASWRLASKGITASGTSSIAATGSTLFAAVGYNLFRSADRGLSWQKAGVTAHSIAAQGSLVAVADPYYALSSDGGQTFAKGSGTGGTTSDDVAVLGDVVLRVTGGLLTRSADRGASFGPVQVTPQSALSNVSFKCDRAKTCYAAGYPMQGAPSYRLYRSTDAGASWIATGRDVSKVVTVTDEGSVYITNTAAELERSDDGAATWETCPKPTNVACSAGVLVARADQAFVACDNSVFRSDDRGRHWTIANGSRATGALTDAASVMFVDRTATARSPNGDLYVGAPFVRNSKLSSSADDGQSWQSVGISSPVACATSGARALICITGSGFVMRSEDHGATWAMANLGSFAGGTVLAGGPSGVYLSANSKFGGVARSDDDGRTFQVVDAYASYTTALQVLKSGNVLRYGGKLFKSVDRGATWTECNVSLAQLPLPEDQDGRLSIISRSQLQVSSDECESWTPVADSPTASLSPTSALLVRDGQGRIYASGPATASAPVIYFKESSSSSSVWGSFAAPPSPYVLQLALDKPGRLLAATTAGVYRFEPE